MRYTYGIMDERKVLLYKPQLFLKDKDLLVFPSADFQKWYNDIKEFLDVLYQIDSWEMEKGNSITITELNLAMGILNNIIEELENLFNPLKTSNSPYHYLSTLDEKYKRQRSSYTSDMRRVDIRIPAITAEMKYKNMMEIVNEAHRTFHVPQKRLRTPKISRIRRKTIKILFGQTLYRETVYEN